MFASIISPAVTEALGHSVVYEEYRGDLAHARRLAEEQLSAARRGSEPVRLADALLACGIVYWLQGEPSGAAACFAEVESAVPDDANRLLLAFSYSVLTTHLRHLIFPHGGASATLETGSRWDQMAAGRANEARWQELTARADDPAARLHAALLYRVLHNVPIGRYVLDGSRDIAGQEETARRAQMLLQPLVIG